MDSLDKHCQDGHEHIVFFGEVCPLCTVQDTLMRASDVVNDALGGYFRSNIALDTPEQPKTPKKAGKLFVMPHKVAIAGGGDVA
jgi:hypothetical protein